MSREYLCAGKIIEAILQKKIPLKSYCNKNKVGKTDYALAVETLKYVSVIKQIFDKAEISAESLDVNYGVLFVMAYELLFGKKKIRGGGAVKRAATSVLPAMQDALSSILKDSNESNAANLIPTEVRQSCALPKYIRINLLKGTYTECVNEIMSQFPSCRPDDMIPNLLVLPADTRGLGEHKLVTESRIIIQDKASCMPSQILFDAWLEAGIGCDFIDACAAPGNKTSHLASLIHQARLDHKSNAVIKTSKVFAFDKSPTRCELLRSRIKAAGADTIVAVTNHDFLTTDFHSEAFANVKSILLDPSCSGSGVARALDRVIEEKFANNGKGDKGNEKEEERIESLARFQLSAVLHAMNNDSVQLITYSTCSVHVQENEGVVARALAGQQPNPKFSPWRVAEPTRFRDWKSRGVACNGLTADDQQKLIRCYPEEGLNGFFVTLFVRDSIGTPIPTELGKRSGDFIIDQCLTKKIWKPTHRVYQFGM
jgi:putative methyltransferase